MTMMDGDDPPTDRNLTWILNLGTMAEGADVAELGPTWPLEARKVKRRKTLKSQGKMEHGSSGGEPDGCKKGVKNGFFANWAMGVEIWKIRQIFCA